MTPIHRRDCVFLAAAVTLSLLWYVARLGFWSDDWAFLGRYVTAEAQNLAGFYQASMSSQHAMRPAQVWLGAALYTLFGLEPLGYHLFNAALLVANALLVYVTARELQAPRTIALAIALTYALLPSYSTDRFWFLAFAIVLSMTACLASTYAALRAVTAPHRTAWMWGTISAAALAVSALSYEVALPLFLLTPLLLFWRWQQEQGLGRGRSLRRLAVLVAVNFALLAGAVLFKLRTTVRLGAQDGIAAQVSDIARQAVRLDLPEGHYGLNVFSALRVHFLDAGVRLPAIALDAIGSAPATLLILTGVFTLFAFGYLALTTADAPYPSRRQWGVVTSLGVIVFSAGYAIFLTNYNVQFTLTGIANRSAIAAALGAAMVLVGIGGALLTWLPPRVAAVMFAALITAISSCSFVILNVVSQRWVEAYETELRVLDRIQRRFPELPSRSTLILDGMCPYSGPAVVFESNWDLAGALQVMYRDPTLAADIVTPRLTLEPEGIITTIYGAEKKYPYGDSLIAYNVATDVAEPLRDARSAQDYFASRPDMACPPAQEGIGVKMF